MKEAARNAIGFMPEAEGLALHEAGLSGGKVGPLLEIGSYCGKSAMYLGTAARERDTVLYSIDHHRGSEEHQAGEEFHDPRLVDGDGNVDTFPEFRRTITSAGLDDVVVPIVAESVTVARGWATPLGLLFIDGGHSEAAARADLEAWARFVAESGLLVIHDVFPDPADGGRPPFLIYEQALSSGRFKEVGAEGSLRVLQRVGNGGV
jgi:predicted O-methyltransferase YrrM